MRKPTIYMGENKDADQLRGNREADQRLCFRYTDSTFPPLLIPKFSRSWVSSVTVQAGLCWTWSETQIVGFVMHRLISKIRKIMYPCIPQFYYIMSLSIRKPNICICENKDADQLCSNCTADQCLCFRYKDSASPPFCVGRGRNPDFGGFSCEGSYKSEV